MINGTIQNFYSKNSALNATNANKPKKENKIKTILKDITSDKKKLAYGAAAAACVGAAAIAGIMLYKKHKINSIPDEARKIQQRAQEIYEALENKINEIQGFYNEGKQNGFGDVVENGKIIRKFEQSNEDAAKIVMKEFDENQKSIRTSTFLDDIFDSFDEVNEKGKINKCVIYSEDGSYEYEINYKKSKNGLEKMKEAFGFDDDGLVYSKKIKGTIELCKGKIKETFYLTDGNTEYLKNTRISDETQKAKVVLMFDEDDSLVYKAKHLGTRFEKIYAMNEKGKLERVKSSDT